MDDRCKGCLLHHNERLPTTKRVAINDWCRWFGMRAAHIVNHCKLTGVKEQFLATTDGGEKAR